MKTIITILTLAFSLPVLSGIKKAGSDGEPGGPKQEGPAIPETRDEPENKGEPEAGRLLEDMLNELLGGGDRKNSARLNNHFRELLEGHKPGAVASAPATYALRDAKRAGRPLGYATGVEARGWMVSKASELKNIGELEVEVAGKWVPAKVSQSWEEHDLALIKAEASGIAVVKWSELPAPEVGTFITAVAPAGRDPLAIGVVSVYVRNIRMQGRGFLGVQVESDDKGLKIGRVVSGGAAEKAGVQSSDRIVELDGKKPGTVFAFTSMISNKKAGDKIKLKIQRGDSTVDKEISLGDLGSTPVARPKSRREQRMASMGSTISERSDNFASVIQTDFPLDASQCGGPVSDLDGNVIGIVIARSGRIETLVLPAQAITEALKTVDFSK